MSGPNKGIKKKVANDDFEKTFEWVYSLRVWNEIDKRWEPFYFGRSINTDRRKREHELASRRDPHTVYKTIRLIDELNFEWEMFNEKEFYHEDYNGEEKDAIINSILENDHCENPYQLVTMLYQYKGIEVNTFLSNEKFGDGTPWHLKYLAKKKLMAEHGFKTVKELNEHEHLKKAERVKQKALEMEKKPKQLLKDKVKSTNTFKEHQDQKALNHKKALKASKDILKGILR